MLGALISDWIKVRKTWIMVLVFLGPFGVVSLTGVRYAVLYSRVVKPGQNAVNWSNLIFSINDFLLPSLILGLALLASLFSGLEHQGHTWKQLLALPVPRLRLYASKFIWLAGLLAFSAILCGIGTLILGLILGFGIHAPWLVILKEACFPYLASYGLIAIQLLVSVLIANQTFSVTMGVLGVVASLAFQVLPKWLPWVYPPLASPVQSTHHVMYIIYGLVVCCLFIALGTSLFMKKEVR